jgi:hypothetical protein
MQVEQSLCHQVLKNGLWATSLGGLGKRQPPKSLLSKTMAKMRYTEGVVCDERFVV